MLPVLVGLIAAAVFGLVSTLTLGTDGLMTNAWVDIVFWSLIGAGAAVSAINVSFECLPCRLSNLKPLRRWHEALCFNAPCHN